MHLLSWLKVKLDMVEKGGPYISVNPTNASCQVTSQ
jgi:hypothetical protein